MERSNKIFGVAGLFDDPNNISSAAEKVVEEGYTDFDVNSSYPIHGMEKKMKLKHSLIGFVTVFFGFSGTAFILFFMWWTMAYNYPMVVGGKPFFSLPAFTPITFEFTILIGTVSTFIGMIAVFFNFPKNSHPLHDTDYMKSVSVDKYGIVIEADDPKFNEENVKSFLQKLGAKNIETIFYPKEEKNRIFEPKFLWFLAAVFIITSGSTYVSLNKLMYIVPFNWMDRGDKLIPQEESTFFKDKFGMRVPPKGTVARGFMPYEYAGELNPPETLKNPLLPTKENLELGHEKFLTFCSPCHGNLGEGNSRLHGQFPPGVSLHSETVRNYTDGRIYNVITNGSTIMPSYERQITRKERWAIVLYVRALQKAENASEADVKEAKEFSSNVQ
jgi:mono/diheme cytochrome c family protein